MRINSSCHNRSTQRDKTTKTNLNVVESSVVPIAAEKINIDDTIQERTSWWKQKVQDNFETQDIRNDKE